MEPLEAEIKAWATSQEAEAVLDADLGLGGLDAFLEDFKTWEREGLAKEPWPSLRAVPPEDIQELMITGLRERVASGDLADDIAVGVACGRMEMLIKEKVASPVTAADKARMLQMFAARGSSVTICAWSGMAWKQVPSAIRPRAGSEAQAKSRKS